MKYDCCFLCRRVHDHDVQRAGRELRHSVPVRLLSQLGPGLELQEEPHSQGNTHQPGRHCLLTGGVMPFQTITLRQTRSLSRNGKLSLFITQNHS